MPFDPTGLILGGLGMVGSTIGGIQQMQRYGDLIRSRNDASVRLNDYIGQNTLPPGVAQNLMFAGLYPQLDFSNFMNAGDFLPAMFRNGMVNQQDQLANYYRQLPGLSTMGSTNPWMDNTLLPHFDAGQQYASQFMNPALGGLAGHGSNDFSSEILSQLLNRAGGPYSSGQNDYGMNLLRNLGINQYNQGGMDLSMFGLNQGGYNGNILDQIGLGSQGANAGLNLFNSGGWNPQANNMMNFAQGGGAQGLGAVGQGTQIGMNGMAQQFGLSPETFLGPRGASALDALGSSPYIPGSYNSVNNFSQQATRNGGYSPQGQQMFNASMPRAFADMDLRNNQISQDRGVALNFAGGNMDALPDWFLPFVANAPGMGGGAGGGFNIPQITAGGGGGGASAGSVSRDLGPQDTFSREAYEKAITEFQKNPLLSMPQVISMARDAAATAALGQAKHNERLAAANGRLGPTVASGMGNAAIAEMGDMQLQEEAKAVREAMLGQQGLQLQRAGQQSGLAQALGGLEQARNQMFMGANIADANNQTSASIANSQAANAAAAQQLQAQMANSQNAIAMAQLQAGIFNNLLGVASDSRGQNLQKQIAGLNALPQMQQNANQRDSMLFNLLGETGQQATSRFGMGGQALGILPQINSNDIDRYTAMINPLVAGQATGTNRGNAYANFGGNLSQTGANLFGSGINGMGNAAQYALGNVNAGTGMFGAGMNAMGQGNNTASNNLSTWGNILGQGQNNMLGFANLGNTAINGGLGNELGFLNAGNNTVDAQLRYALGLGGIGTNALGQYNSNMNNYGGLNNDAFRNDIGNRTLGGNLLRDYSSASNQSWNPFFQGVQQTMAPYASIQDQTMRYMMGAQGLWGPYAGMFGIPGAPTNALAGMAPNTNINWNGGR